MQAPIVYLRDGLPFLTGTVGVIAQSGQTVRSLGPDRLQHRARGTPDFLCIAPDRNLVCRPWGSNNMRASAKSMRPQDPHDLIARAATYLNQDPEFFVEQRLVSQLQTLHRHLLRADFEVAPIGSVRIDRQQIQIDHQTATTRKGHFGERNKEAAVRTVVVRKHLALLA